SNSTKGRPRRAAPTVRTMTFKPPKRLQGIEKSVIRQVFDRALPGSINLGLGEPDLPTPDVIRKAAAKVIVEEQNGYTSHAGLPALREKVANEYPYLEGRPDRVVITAGSQEALYLALLALVDEGDEVLLPNPGFVAYPTIVRMAGGVSTFYRLPRETGFAFDRDEFRRALTPRTKVVVCISPSNPTGRVLTNDDLASIADAVRDTQAYLISDEIYRELYYGDERPETLSNFYDRTIVISGLSKSMSMTGWRLGWLCGDEALVQAALVLHGYVTTCASTVSQKASLVSWTDEAEAARAGFRETFRARRDHLLRLINEELGLRAVTPDGAFYTMLDVSKYGPSMRVAEALLREKVITVPGAAFGSESEGFLRVSFCANHETLEEGVRRIKRGLTLSSTDYPEKSV
ncbi:MAG TPA: aminotransferase class I/II-fold pyridoxal phosphate-dependent enzyme, partial [Pyrinomonadaceae bacterium]|nr:aminotransferase class I/II-fold pyridoxal phosphate-dependent enzyme [Pyrinomonadaceae bacterium]